MVHMIMMVGKMDIKELEDNFNTLSAYSDKQFKTINELNREIEKLKAENISLQKMLEGNLPQLEFENGHLGISNEQMICETQLCILKDRAIQKELNADEAKRVSLYVEVLEKIRKNHKTEDMSIKKLSDTEILKLVVDNGTSK